MGLNRFVLRVRPAQFSGVAAGAEPELAPARPRLLKGAGSQTHAKHAAATGVTPVPDIRQNKKENELRSKKYTF